MNQSEIGVGMDVLVDGKKGKVIEHHYAYKEVWPAGQDRFVVEFADKTKSHLMASDIRAPEHHEPSFDRQEKPVTARNLR